MSDLTASLNSGHSALQTATRVGFACKGIVYLLAGVLMVLETLDGGKRTADKDDAMRTLGSAPFGDLILPVMGAGLLAYALWRVLSAIRDTEDKGNSAKGIARRCGYLISALIYGGLGYDAFRRFAGKGSGGGDEAASLTATVLTKPGGTLLVIGAGIGLIIFGVTQVRYGLKRKFLKHLRTGQMSADEKRWAERAGKFGYPARGVVFGLMGVFLLIAGMEDDSSEVRSTKGVLEIIASLPFGTVLLMLVAAGLALYGLYTLFESRYRTVRTH